MSKAFDQKWGEDFIRTVPTAPGIYIFRNEKGEPIYVGKARSLRKRLAQYRLATAKRVHRKMRLIVRSAHSLDFQSCTTETEALLLENQLIQKHRPLFNVVGAYAFLYPYLGLKQTASRELAICYTTQPEILESHGFQLFGAFRSREVVTAAFDALSELFSYVGHDDPALRVTFGRIAYSRIVCFRQVDAEWVTLLTGLFRGESGDALQRLFTHLLEKPGARRHAETVQIHLQQLRAFFVSEAVRLRTALRQQGRDVSMVPQKERDGIFLACRMMDEE